MADTMTTNEVDALDALRVSPAAHLADEMEAVSRSSVSGEGGQAVSLREIPFTVQLGLRAVPGSESAQAIESSLSVTLPTAVGEVTGDPDGLHVIWLSPDEFLSVDVSRRQQPGETVAVEAALEGLPGQVVDLSANRTILVLEGTEARSVLEKTCRADLHPRVFAVGSALLTQVGQVPVILHRTAENTYRLFPRASFAEHLVRWLLDGMHEFTKDA
ncbi:sarcosine oxidase subunit gamma family protein [Brevibacterium sp.]|uniref:sarcosine oxidase subunit gamma n=1 Tax=Brevibacterium sp. TaxID=1701 RepID=UPI0028109F8C|nr:sarcosine oxidase subunit gamma family protein [Brevibacterium sp.]